MPITYDVKTLTPAEALEHIKLGATILDPITPEAYERLHLKGAVNVCVYEIAFIAKATELLPDKAAAIVVYANTETSHEALNAATKLGKLGYSNVYVAKGGINALIEAGCETEGSDDELNETLAYVSGKYEADTATALISWTGRNVNTTHHGTVALKQGSLGVEGEIISGSFTVDMTRMTNTNLTDASMVKMLLGHLHSGDFFSVRHFPEADFAIETAERTHDATISSVNHTLHGNLTICGVTHPFNLPATLIQRDENTLVLESHFDFDRTQWGITYGSAKFFSFLGMHMIFDPVSIAVRVELKALP